MSALRIGMFTDSYLPRVSGAVRSVHASVEQLRRLGHTVWIVTPRHAGAPDDDHLIPVPSLRLRSYPDFPFAVPVSPALFARLRGLGLDVVHAHSPFLMGRAAAFVAGQTGAPLVFTHHTLYTEYLHYVPVLGPAITRPLVERYVTAYANGCACVIAPSAFVRALLADHGVTSRIEVIPGAGPDPAEMAALDAGWARREYGIPAGPPLLFTVSRLAPEKSVDLVIRAFAQIAATRPAHLLIAGDGPEREALETLASDLEVGDRVTFAGMIAHEQVLAAARGADLFLYASQSETQGLVVVEAMAAGLPVVAVGAAGVADVVPTDAGALVPADAAALAEAAAAYLGDPERRRAAGERGRHHAARYTIAAVTDALVAAYRSVGAGTRDSGGGDVPSKPFAGTSRSLGASRSEGARPEATGTRREPSERSESRASDPATAPDQHTRA